MIKFYGDMGAAQGISTLSDMVDALDFWQDNTKVDPGDIARSSKNSMIYAVAQTAGVTGTVEPVWGNTAGVTITDNTVTWLVKDIRTADTAQSAVKWTAPIKINGVDVDGSHDITLPADTVDNASYIGSGLKVSSFDGLNVNIGSGRAKIAGNGISFPGGQLALNPRKASLMYLDSNGTLGKIDCANPLDFIDDNTIGCWKFNQTTAGANIPNSAVGKSAIAVDNDLVPHGGITSVDGWFDNSLQLDGSAAYFIGSNTTNFPSGAAEREVNHCVTINSFATIGYLFSFGSTSYPSRYACYINTDGMLYVAGAADVSTGFVVEKGKTYLVGVGYDGTNLILKIGGIKAWSVAVALSTTLTNSLCVGAYMGGGQNYAAITTHYIELRNKMRSDVAAAVIANKMIFPCFYDKPYGLYPVIPDTDKATAYHEYKLDETSGTTVADTAGTSNGTAGASSVILDSPTLNGKSRKCDGTLAGSINLGVMSLPSAFTILGVITPIGNAGSSIFSNRINGSVGSQLYIGVDNRFTVWNGDTNLGGLTSTDPLAQDSKNFFALAFNNTKVDAYVNSTIPTQGILSAQAFTQNSNPLYLGYDVRNAAGHAIAWDYLLIIPRALTQAEISQIYNSLMVTGRRNIIDDVIPANAISLGFIRTNSSKVIEKNDSWYKFGRREGATGGNRKVFLPWKYFTSGVPLKWDNPFGSGKYKKEIHWSQDAKGTNEVVCYQWFQNSGATNFGVIQTSYATGYNDAQNVTILPHGGGVTCFNSAWQTSGYLGVYIEVLEDYKGADAA